MNKFCLLACVAVLLLGAALADETGSTGEREKRQFIAPDGMVMVPVPVDAIYEQPSGEMFSNVPVSAMTLANSRSVDALTANTEEKSGASPIEVRQFYRPYGWYGPYGPRPYGPYGPRPYYPYGPYNPYYRPYGIGASFGVGATIG